MPASLADIIIHPVRLRIMTALVSRELTSQQIAAILPDVAQATLYRHIKALSEAGILTVVSSSPVRGTMEKRYALNEEATRISPEEMRRASRDDHQRYFAAFTASLLGQFRFYLQSAEINPQEDRLIYRTAPLDLTRDERERFLRAMQDVTQDARQKTDTEGERRRYNLSVVIIPEKVDTLPPASPQSASPAPGSKGKEEQD